MDIGIEGGRQWEGARERSQGNRFHSTYYLTALLVVSGLHLGFESNAQPISRLSEWDKGLADIRLVEVQIRGSSASNSWQLFSTRFAVRSVLYIDESVPKARFTFERSECTVRDFFEAFATWYGLTRVIDPATGVNWFFPSSMKYSDVLSCVIEIPRESYGLPMLSGVLEPLSRQEQCENLSLPGNLGSSGFKNTFDFGVDIPSGHLTVREILNLCAIANPNLAFHVERFPTVSTGRRPWTATELIPLLSKPLMGMNVRSPTPGAREFWNREIGQSAEAPSKEQILAAMSSESARIRWAARRYVEAGIQWLELDKWRLDSSLEKSEAAWMFLGLLSIFVRNDEVGHEPWSVPLREIATPEFLATCREDLAILASMELVRVAGVTSGFDAVARRKFTTSPFVDITSDAARIARQSPEAWQSLRDVQGGIGAKDPIWARTITDDSPSPTIELPFEVIEPIANR